MAEHSKSRLKTARVKGGYDRFKKEKEDLEEFIREHPLLSVAIAAWIGYMICKIFDKK